MKYQLPPGVFDILPVAPKYLEKEEWKSIFLWQHVESIVRKISDLYGFSEIRTPVIEKTELFTRSSGESSDIVSKEMYTFEDRGKRSLSLRPEGTAPVMRAYLNGKLQSFSPQAKLYYIAPMFRYDRPQAGRYRQHHQFGAEAIGNKSPEQDAEIIDLAHHFCSQLGLKNLTILIGSLGDEKSRADYTKALKEYLSGHFKNLSEESQLRFESNPLRILDSKSKEDQKILIDAPILSAYLSQQSAEYFEKTRERLDQLGIPYKIDTKLVRGLDYYNETVFEIVSQNIGSQASVGGGGRYDGLLKALGGPDLPSAGFGFGLERLMQTMLAQNVQTPKINGPDLFLIALSEQAKSEGFSLLQSLRKENIKTHMDFSTRKLGKIMGYANSINAKNTLILGDSEIKEGVGKIKEMETGKETPCSLKRIKEYFRKEKRS